MAPNESQSRASGGRQLTAASGILAASAVASIGVALVWYAMRCADREHETVLWFEAADRIIGLGKAFEANAAAIRTATASLSDLAEAIRIIVAACPTYTELVGRLDDRGKE